MSIWKPVTRPRHDAARKFTLLLTLPGLLLGLLLWQGKSGAAAPADVQWSSPQHLSAGASAAFRPILGAASDGNKVMVAYNRRVAGGEDQNPYYSLSNDGGATWSAPAAIRSADQDLRQVALAFDSGNTAHAVWRTESGLAHAAETQWPSGNNPIPTTSDVILDPSLAIGGDDVLHVLWAQGGGNDPHNIYHAYSTNGGADWSTPSALATATEHSSVPVVAVDAANNVHVVWEERIFDISLEGFFRYQVHYRKGTKNGANYAWSSADILSGSLIRARRPSLLAAGDDIHVSFAREVYDDDRLQARQYPYHTSFEPGSGWNTPADASGDNPVRVNTNIPFYLITALAACGNSVHLNYHGAEEADSNAKEQIWGTTMRSGNNWGAVTPATGGDTRNINPSVACGGGNVHLAFERVEQATVNHQIYYATEHNTNGAFLPVMLKQ